MEVPESVMCPVWQSTNESLQITDSPCPVRLAPFGNSFTSSMKRYLCILHPASYFSAAVFTCDFCGSKFSGIGYIYYTRYIHNYTYISYHIIYIYMYVHYYVYNVYQCISCTTSCSLSICMCQVSIYFYICMHISFLVLSFFCGKQTFSARYL